MPYKSTKDLPDNVRHVLPAHAQDIFMEAFNNAYNEYKDPGERRLPQEGREETAFKVAWSAVKKKYKKDEKSGKWVPLE